MRRTPPFEFVEDVTSDVTFVARGPTLGELFSAAADALLAITLEDPESLREAESRRLDLCEPDLELLLLVFLNELVYLRDAEGLLLRVRKLEVEEREEGPRLLAELVGERMDPVRHRPATEVKAATAHGLSIFRDESGYRARVTLDV